MKPAVGVLAMAYGTPRDREDVAAYYTDIRRGRPPTPELLAGLVMRYDAIGGTFPLRAITAAQCRGLQGAFDERWPGRFTVALGQKHAAPYVEDGVRELVSRGVARIVGLVLAPHYSAYSVGQYAGRAGAEGGLAGVPVDTIGSWHRLPAYLDFTARAVTDALTRLPEGSRVLFTAHALPERIVAGGDRYPEELRGTAEAVAARLALPPGRWSVGFQSAGRTPEPWTGPDVLDVVRRAAAAGEPGIAVSACGFVADHLEVAFDLDVEAARVAAEAGIAFARTASVNDDPAVLRGLAELVAAGVR